MKQKVVQGMKRKECKNAEENELKLCALSYPFHREVSLSSNTFAFSFAEKKVLFPK